MSHQSQPPEQLPRQKLQNYCASQSIDLQFCQWPEFRLELVDGKFVVGGTLQGSRWLLKEALLGWGLESAIAFAPVEQWWEALCQAYDISCQSDDDWLTWAESLPISSDYRDPFYPPLGSKYAGEHRWIRDYLRQALSSAMSQAGWGKCFGPNYGMQMDLDVLTPDILVLTTRQMAQNIAHNCYAEIAAYLVVEITFPEQDSVDRQSRKARYEQAEVQHYWIVDPDKKTFEFWRWSSEGYQLSAVDPDGCYRGIADLSFSSDIFWLGFEQDASPYIQTLPAFTSVHNAHQWELRKEPGVELGYGSVPFTPSVGLLPQPISPEQFIAWCPETKLEGGPFPLIGGGETGTRNAIAMLLMSLGLVETVRLVAGYEWVRSLRHVTRNQQQDSQKRDLWWRRAREIAQQLKVEHGVGGIGVIGSLIGDQPLNRWSEIHLVLWDTPEEFKKWRIFEILPDNLPVKLTEAVWALPEDWQEISQRMQILEGTWGAYGPRPRERMIFHWKETSADT